MPQFLSKMGQLASVGDFNTTNKNTNYQRFLTTKWRPEDPTNYDTLKLQCQMSSNTVLLIPDEDLKSVLECIDLKAGDWVVFFNPEGNILIIFLFSYCHTIY